MYTSLSFVIFHHHGIHVEKIQRVYREEWSLTGLCPSMSIIFYYTWMVFGHSELVQFTHDPQEILCRTQVSKCIDDACHFKHPGNHRRVRHGCFGATLPAGRENHMFDFEV